MALAWFICTYKRRDRPGSPRPARYCAMDDFTPQIQTDGGEWSETEVLGNYAVVKVRASDATLNTIAAAVGYFRLPLVQLADRLSTLTGAQRTAIRSRLIAMGYTDEELTTALGNLRDRNLGEVLRVAASRRRKPRYDGIADEIVLDGEIQTCRSVDEVDAEVV